MNVKKILFFVPIFLSLALRSWGAEGDFSSFNSITTVMVQFLKDVDAVINAIFANGEISSFVQREWTFFSLLLISFLFFNYIFAARQGFMQDVFNVILTIGVTKVLINYYDSLTTAFWGWSVGFAEGIQQAAVGNTELFFFPSFIFNACKSLAFGDQGFLDISVTGLICSIILGVMGLALSILGVLAALWSIWGYSLAKIIGWMFIPTLMFERLSWLFDGWLRFFFGMLLYNVIARANLVLVAIVMKNLIGAATFDAPGAPIQVVYDGLFDVAGLILFLLIGILGLVSTGKFAVAIAGGSGGVGGAILQAIRFATGSIGKS